MHNLYCFIKKVLFLLFHPSESAREKINTGAAKARTVQHNLPVPRLVGATEEDRTLSRPPTGNPETVPPASLLSGALRMQMKPVQRRRHERTAIVRCARSFQFNRTTPEGRVISGGAKKGERRGRGVRDRRNCCTVSCFGGGALEATRVGFGEGGD